MGQTGAEAKLSCPNVNRVFKKCQIPRKQSASLPKGLVGARCVAEVSIAGKKCHCLLDTGSQVTTVPKSFYEQHLSAYPINSLDDILEVEGANGLSVPYEGYIKVDVTFPEEFLGTTVEVATVALVVPDVQSHTQPLVLIGTNTLDILYEQQIHEKSPRHQPSLFGYRVVLKTLETRRKQNMSGILGHVRLRSNVPEVMSAGQTVVVEGSVAVPGGVDKCVVVEHPSDSSLPGGVFVKRCLLTPSNSQPVRLPVVLRNETEHDIAIPPRCIIAELHAVESVLPQSSVSPVNRHPPMQESNFTLNFGESPLSQAWRDRISAKLREMPDVFSQHDLDFGHTQKVKHRIQLHDETPFKHRARPIHPQDLEAVRRHLRDLLASKVIRESESPFSSPIVVVRKKNGDVRLCIDYRKLNLQTVKDAYALPNLEETFSALTGSKWFSVLDLKSGYYQIEVEEADKPKTAFVCPLGFWEFNRMPQGVTNAPSTFQRLMEKCMEDINLREVLVFLDDLIIFSETLEEHERRLLKVLSRLREYGLKLALEKCKFFQTSVRYLGHIVSERGVETDPEKIEALKTWPSPTNLKELRSFLGFSGYYRRFIKDYSRVVKPLTDLTVGYPPTRKGSKRSEGKGPYHNPKEPFGGRWTQLCEEAFRSVIDKLTTAPVLGFANPKLSYFLHTDASIKGLGAALYQEQEGQMRVIAYASRGLSRSESHYPAHKLEFLALKWAVTEKFRDYLYGSQFTVITDSNPLTYVLTTARLDATSYRWLAALSTFSFKLQYRAGKLNADADGLSRRPQEPLAENPVSQKEYERIQQFMQHHLTEATDAHDTASEVVQAICEKHLVRQPTDVGSGIAFVESLALYPDAIPDSYEQEDDFEGLPVVSFLSRDLCDEQRADPVIREVISSLESGEKPSPTVRKELPDLPFFLREWSRLELKDGVLYRKRKMEDSVTYQLVLPEDLRPSVLSSLHDSMGHMGVERTLDLVRSRFYWPKMAAEVEQKIRTCGRCVRRKALPQKATPLVNIQATRPLELVCMDFLSLEPDKSNTRDILVITDFFTKYAVAVPTPNQKARTVAKCLWENFVVQYGFPERLHSDQGPDFESRTIKELCEMAGVKKTRTTPYHPRGNPVERFNRTLLSMLGTLEEKDKVHWRDFVKPLAHAYNCTRHEVTGFTPYELMFGRQPRLPVDLAFGLPYHDSPRQSHSEYVRHLKNNLKESYLLASRGMSKSAERNKARFDKSVTHCSLEIGDRVLVRNVRLRGKHKLADKWESEVYVVVNQAADLPVYTVRPERKDGPLRTLHRDLLLPCGFLPSPEVETPTLTKPISRPRTRQSLDVLLSDDVSLSDSEEGNSYCGYNQPPNMETVRFSTVHDICKEGETVSGDSDDNPAKQTSPNGGFLQGDQSEYLPVENLPVRAPHEYLPVENQPVSAPRECLPVDVLGVLEQSNLPDKGQVEVVMGNSVDGVEVIGVEISDVPEKETEQHSEDEIENTDTMPRRSVRQREKPERLTYVQPGNPLIYVVQSLFQGLNSAFVKSLGGDKDLSVPPLLSNGSHDVVTSQPNRTCKGACMNSGGENVTQVR